MHETFIPEISSRRLLGLVGLASLLVCACDDSRMRVDHRLDNAAAIGASNPELRHAIGFTSRSEHLDVEVPPGFAVLSPNQNVDIYRFLASYKREASGRLAISVPVGVGDPGAVSHALRAIVRHVNDAGLGGQVVRARRNDKPATGTAFIRLAYQRPVTVPPACDHWTEDVGRNEERIPYPNWGCATQRNLAVMVDNARDLRQPQLEDPRAGERRSVSWSAYAGTRSSGDTSSEAAKKILSPAK